MESSTASLVLERSNEISQASILNQSEQRPQSVQRYELDLSVERIKESAMLVNFPFKSFYVEDATDNLVRVGVKPTTLEEIQSHFVVGLKDSYSVEKSIPKCYLFWAAQPGKKATIVFFTDSEFRSGSQVSRIAGGLSISGGEVLSAASSITLAATTATIIAPQKLDRKRAYIQNKTGAPLFVAGTSALSNTGATEGIEYAPGAIIVHDNTAELWGYSVGGGKITRVEGT